MLAVSIGNFGDRFGKIAKAYGAEVTMLELSGGRQPTRRGRATPSAHGGRRRGPQGGAGDLQRDLHRRDQPAGRVGAAIRAEAPDTLILVDAVSGVGAVPLEMDAWDLDVVVTGAQKAWMSHPVWPWSRAARGLEAAESATMPRFYFDLAKHREVLAKGQTPWTPAVGVFFQLEAALEMIEAGGLCRAIPAPRRLCGSSRAGLVALGFELFADQARASTVTAAWFPTAWTGPPSTQIASAVWSSPAGRAS